MTLIAIKNKCPCFFLGSVTKAMCKGNGCPKVQEFHIQYGPILLGV